MVSHASADLASCCVRQLRRFLAYDHVVAVVNSSEKVAADELAVLALDARVVSPPGPQGYGANLNLGIRSLPPTVEFVVLANDDVEFPDESLPRLLDRLSGDGLVGAIGPALRNSEGTPVSSVGVFPTGIDAILRSTALPGHVRTVLRNIEIRRQIARRAAREGRVDGTEPVDWVVGAALAVRMAALRDMGEFDERFFLYFEETDFCYRLWDSGWAVVTASDISVIHLQGQSTVDAGYRSVFREARRRYLIKRLGRFRWALLELAFLGALTLATVANVIGALASPATAARRLDATKEGWRDRVFLLLPQRKLPE